MKEPVWIETRDALALHDRLLALDGGAQGIRDPSLLASALARPRQRLAYGEKSSDTEVAGPYRSAYITELAALYTSALVRNHPFVDGDKRTAFMVGVLFLELNGMRFIAPEADAAQAVIRLAANEITEVEYAAFLSGNVKEDRS